MWTHQTNNGYEPMSGGATGTWDSKVDGTRSDSFSWFRKVG